MKTVRKSVATSDGNDIIQEALGISPKLLGNDVLRLSGINSTLMPSALSLEPSIILTKSGNDLLIQLKDDNNNIITNNSITIKDQFTGSNANGTGNEILKKIEFADGYSIDLTTLTTVPATDGNIALTPSAYSLTPNIDTAIQEELILGYNDQMQITEDQDNPTSTYNANNYNTSGEQEEIDSEKYNEMQWRSYKKKRSSFGFIAAGESQQKQSSGLFLAINENSAMPNLGREPSSSRRRRKAAKRFETNSVYFLKTKEEAFSNDNFKTQTQLKSFKKQIFS